MSDSPIKYQRLAHEYAKLKAQNQVLKQAVVEVKGKYAEMQDDLRSKEQSIRRSQQELESSNFRSQQMERRVQMLQADLESNNKKTRNGDIPNISYSPNISAINEDLSLKIVENEQLHKKVFESDSKLRAVEGRLKEEINIAQNETAAVTKKFNALQEMHKTTNEKLLEDKAFLELKLHQVEHKNSTRLFETKKLVDELNDCKEKLGKATEKNNDTWNNVIVFNDRESQVYNNIQIDPYNKRNQMKAGELIKHAISLFDDFCKSLCMFHYNQRQRSILYPVDSNHHTLSPAVEKLSHYLIDHAEYVNPMQSSLKESLSVIPNSLHSAVKLRHFAQHMEKYVNYFAKLNPYSIASISEECELSVCAPSLQTKNNQFLESYKKLLPSFQKLNTYISLLASSASQPSKVPVANEKQAFHIVQLSLNELHLTFTDLCRAFNGKIALEQHLPTTSKEPALGQANEFLLSSMLSLSSHAAKLSTFLLENINFFSQDSRSPQVSALNSINVRSNALDFMSTVMDATPPPSVPYEEAILNKKTSASNDKDKLYEQLEKTTKKVRSLEEEKEHWMLETQLLKMKLDKRSVDFDGHKEAMKSVRSNNKRSDSQSLPTDTSMLGTITPISDEELTNEPFSMEDLIKEHMSARVNQLSIKIQHIESKTLHYEAECRSLQNHLKVANGRKKDLQTELESGKETISQLRDELAVTRRNYDEQLSLMSEHLAAMNDKLANQKDTIDNLKAKTTTTKGLKLPGLR